MIIKLISESFKIIFSVMNFTVHQESLAIQSCFQRFKLAEPKARDQSKAIFESATFVTTKIKLFTIKIAKPAQKWT